MKTLISATAILTLATGLAQAQDTVRLGTEGAYPPYNFLDDSGEVAGFERELGDELCARAELECTWVTNDWIDHGDSCHHPGRTSRGCNRYRRRNPRACRNTESVLAGLLAIAKTAIIAFVVCLAGDDLWGRA